MTSGRLVSAACALVALAALLAALERGHAAWKAVQANRLIASAEIVKGAPPSVVFAHAVALDRAGRDEDALGAYAEAEAIGDASMRHAVRVNVANLYLRRGLAVARDDGNAQRALVLLQLAKTGYRRALREQPDDWNARYNLELAQRILPDFEVRNWRRSGTESEVEDALRKDKSAWTEMVGQPRGMH